MRHLKVWLGLIVGITVLGSVVGCVPSKPPADPWELVDFQIEILERDPSSTWIGYGSRPVTIVARAAAQNRTRKALEDVHLYVWLPEHTDYVTILGWAHGQRRRVPSHGVITVEFHQTGDYYSHFKKEIPLSELALYLEADSTVTVEWLEAGSKRSQVLKPAESREEGLPD